MGQNFMRAGFFPYGPWRRSSIQRNSLLIGSVMNFIQLCNGIAERSGAASSALAGAWLGMLIDQVLRMRLELIRFNSGTWTKTEL